jgi:tight adherence protein C
MNHPTLVSALWFAAAVCGVALLMRLIRSHRLASAPPLPMTEWPWLLRICGPPARLLAPPMEVMLPAGLLERVRRRLERADLHPGMESPEWIALRCVTGATLGILAALLMAALDTSMPTLALIAAFAGWAGTELWLRRRITDCERRIVRELPSCLDLLTVCVEAGATLTSAVRLIVEQAPSGPLRNYFERVLREVRSGRLRSQAFVSVADAYGVECLSTLANALAHAEAAGMSVGTVLRTQSEQRSAERFVRAERLAMQAPVKMLGPLIFCIFPCTFIVLAVPIAHKLMEAFG